MLFCYETVQCQLLTKLPAVRWENSDKNKKFNLNQTIPNKLVSFKYEA